MKSYSVFKSIDETYSKIITEIKKDKRIVIIMPNDKEAFKVYDNLYDKLKYQNIDKTIISVCTSSVSLVKDFYVELIEENNFDILITTDFILNYNLMSYDILYMYSGETEYICNKRLNYAKQTTNEINIIKTFNASYKDSYLHNIDIDSIAINRTINTANNIKSVFRKYGIRDFEGNIVSDYGMVYMRNFEYEPIGLKVPLSDEHDGYEIVEETNTGKFYLMDDDKFYQIFPDDPCKSTLDVIDFFLEQIKFKKYYGIYVNNSLVNDMRHIEIMSKVKPDYKPCARILHLGGN